jgi:hypothetical protein
MAVPSLPFTFSANTPIVSAQVDQNFTTIYAALNAALDSTNFSLARGLGANYITSSGVGVSGAFQAGAYSFAAGTSAQTPLTLTSLASASVPTAVVNMGTSQSVAGLQINGATSITGDIFQALLTPGGTKAAWLTSAGAFNVGSNSNASTAGDLGVSRTASTALIKFGTAASLDFGVTVASQFSFNEILNVLPVALGNLNLQTIVIPSNGPGNAGVLGTEAGGVQGVAGTALCVSNGFSTKLFTINGTNGNVGILGAVSSGSSRALKKNIVPLSHDAFADIMATTILEYNYIGEDDSSFRHIGFIAEETPRSLTGLDGKSVETYSLVSMQISAFQQLVGKLKAAGVAGF